jgi:hypothetical protein
MQTEKKTTYTENHKRFYARHREEIREKRKTSDHDYYERNKERIKERMKAYYHARKGLTPASSEIQDEAPASDSPASPDPSASV